MPYRHAGLAHATRGKKCPLVIRGRHTQPCPLMRSALLFKPAPASSSSQDAGAMHLFSSNPPMSIQLSLSSRRSPTSPRPRSQACTPSLSAVGDVQVPSPTCRTMVTEGITEAMWSMKACAYNLSRKNAQYWSLYSGRATSSIKIQHSLPQPAPQHAQGAAPQMNELTN